MPEYMKLRCCMCPNINKNSQICPGIKATPHPEASQCRYVKLYTDNRGWIYYVRSGIGQGAYKGFYAKNETDYKSGIHQHGMRMLGWCKTFDKAQSELNIYAEKKCWKEWKEID